MRVPWTARRSNQSILKEISPGCSLEGLMLKLKLQYSGHLMQRVDSFEKTLMLGKIDGGRRRGWQRMRRLDDITDWCPGDGQGGLACCSPWGCTKLDTTEATSHACMHLLEKETAAHSSILAWRIPGMEDPGWLPSIGLHRVGHN